MNNLLKIFKKSKNLSTSEETGKDNDHETEMTSVKVYPSSENEDGAIEDTVQHPLLPRENESSSQQDHIANPRQSNGDSAKPPRPLSLKSQLGEQKLPKKIDNVSANDTFNQIPSTSTVTPNLITRPSRDSVVDNRIVRLNTRLLDAVEENNQDRVIKLLKDGANSNATCRGLHVTACHAAAYTNGNLLRLLTNQKADKDRTDKCGRKPLHFAAWGGRNSSISLLLDFPTELQCEEDDAMEQEAEKKLKALRPQFRSKIDRPCVLKLGSTVTELDRDSIEHKCIKYMTAVPEFFPGWTPLHVASYAAHDNTTRLLLVAGANPNSKDGSKRTPLDIAGSACFEETCHVDVNDYVETIKTLIEFGSKLNTTESSASEQVLHTAVQLCSVEAIHVLLEAGASITHRNEQGNTPLHECVSKRYIEPLQVLANHRPVGETLSSVDVTDSNGHTVLQTAILASWIPGVCVALDAGASATLQDKDGYTAIHLAAREGNVDILKEIFKADPYIELNDLENAFVDTPLFCAIRKGDLACVQLIRNAGASLKLTTYHESKDKIRHIPSNETQGHNMIVHATAQVGKVEILKWLLNSDKELQKLFKYKCPYLDRMLPLEFAAFQDDIDMKTYLFLLRKTISIDDELYETFDSSKLLGILISKNRDDMLLELLKRLPNAVRNYIKNGKFPLHQAIERECGLKMILLLIDHGADLSQCDEFNNTAISLFSKHRTKPTEFISRIFDYYIKQSKDNNFDIVINYCALIPKVDTSKEEKQMRVVEAILKTGNRSEQRKLLAHPLVESFLYLKWQTLANFYYLLVFLYSLFALFLSIYIVSFFYYKDQKDSVLIIWVQILFLCIIYIILVMLIIQEFLSRTSLALESWMTRIRSPEFWVKFGIYGLGFITPFVITIESPDTELRRHLISLTLLLVWLMFSHLLSKIPSTGYYIQMFWNVSKKIVCILLIFLVMIIMFSFCFMIEFHFKEPFNGPWSAFVKTLVMMTSEFDYGGTFNDVEENATVSKPANTTEIIDQPDNQAPSIQLLRVIFVCFLVLAAIVLMNLMTGIAVDDVQNLILDGDLQRLEKQVEFLVKLETSRGNKSLLRKLRMFRTKKVAQELTINVAKTDSEGFTQGIKERLMNKALEQDDGEESKIDMLLQAVNELKNIITEMKTSK